MAVFEFSGGRSIKMKRTRLIICTTAFLSFVAPVWSQDLEKSHFVIGGYITEPPQTLMKKFSPLFENYLTETVGRSYSPNVTFELIPVDYTSTTTSEILFNAGLVDFIYTHPTKLVCLEASSGFATIATQRSAILGKEAGGYGGTIFALESNVNVQTVYDIRNKRVGVAHFLASGGFSLPYKMLKDVYNIDIFTETRQLVFYQNDYSRCVMDVLSGTIDLAFTQSGFLEASFPDKLPLLRIIRHINATFQGEDYPFQTSTDIIPTFGIMASPNVPWHLRQRVASALFGINSTHPAAVSAQISQFTVPSSYSVPRETALRLDILQDLGSSYTCANQFLSSYDLLHCPDGYMKPSRSDVENGCAANHTSCPDELECFCRPCIVDDDLTVFPHRFFGSGGVVGSPCQKMKECIAIEQNEPIQLHIRNLRSRSVAVSAHINNQLVKNCTNSNASLECTVDISISVKGLILIEVLADGVQAPTSPILIRVVEKACSNGTEAVGFALLVADELGRCVCPALAFDISGRCVSASLLLTVTVVPGFLVLLVSLLIYGRYRIEQQDTAWKIQSTELMFDDPPEVLGRGTFGLVLKATFRNTPVAVKKVLPPLRRTSCVSSSSVASPAEIFALLDSKHYSSGSSTQNGSTQNTIVDIEADLCRANVTSATGSAMGSTRNSMSSSLGFFDRWDRNQRLRARLKQDFLSEIRLLAHLRHPNIIPLMGAVVDKEEPLLVMEFMNLGSLWDLLRNESVEMDGSMALQVLQGVVQGMSFLHASNPVIIHGDLKSSNVLVNDKFQARISDFGLSQKRRLAKGIVGTPFWTAPECLNGGSMEPHSDVYSFAITVWEVMSRKEPYIGENEIQVLRNVRKGSKRPEIPQGCGRKMEALIVDCWDQDPSLRPTFAEIEKRMHMIPSYEVRSSAWVRLRASTLSKTKSLVSWERCFPSDTVKAVGRGEKAAPIRKPMVSVFFSDVVGFTTISSGMDALKVSDMLDRLYMRFDSVAESMGVSKIETIGDAYICATNLCDDQEDTHAATLARFAMAAVQAASETLVDADRPEAGHVCIRAGICSGPVTGCLIGTKHLKFTLLGDTVNVASRMESTSTPGHIQCAEATANLIRVQDPSIPLVLRGPVEVKGKGRMMTSWVAKAPPPQDSEANASAQSAPSKIEPELLRSVVDVCHGFGGGDDEDAGRGERADGWPNGLVKPSVVVLTPDLAGANATQV